MNSKVFQPNFPLVSTYAIDCPIDYVAPILAFNYAVWKFRQPAQTSILVESLAWILDRLTEHALAQLLCIKKPTRNCKKPLVTGLIEEETVFHDVIVSAITPNTFICYTDGSASPNPGPSGAGLVSSFLRIRVLLT